MSATRKPYKVLDRTRSSKKGVMASSLEEFTLTSRRKLGYPPDIGVMVVLEEDGTEVDDDDYFQTLEPNTTLMLLHVGDRWSPLGVSGVTGHGDVTDHGDHQHSLHGLLLRIVTDPGSISLLTEADMELLADMDIPTLTVTHSRYDKDFLNKIQEAATKHLSEKSQIRDTLALLKLYHKSNLKSETKRDNSGGEKRESTRKRQKANTDTVDKK